MVSARSSRFFGRLWVIFTTLLIAFISYSVQIFVIFPWYGSEVSVDLLILLGPFNTLIGMLYWNYFMTVATDPGSVPETWKPEGDGYEVKKLTGGPRFCRMCEKYKPPRAHHCRQCKRCVLRMDHHCPWVNNCVGHFNYAHFIRFLFFVDVACSYHLWMLTARAFGAYNAVHGYWIEPSATELVFIILNYVTCVPVILAVGAFSFYHFYCLMNNTTTIEGWEKDKVATLIRRGKISKIEFPYNLGVKENVYAVLGPSPLYWAFPTKQESSGLNFKIAPGEDPNSQQDWPPQDPYDNPRAASAESPWTYGGETLNPSLQPSNAYRRAQNARGRSNVPPYHPAYRPSESSWVRDDSDNERHTPSTSSRRSPHEEDYSDYEIEPWGGPRVRRGSEGFEVREQSRDEILQRYLASRGEEAGRYKRYVPEPDSESEYEDGTFPNGHTLDTPPDHYL